MNKLFTVARYEFGTNARRWEFLIVTIGLPLLSAGLILLASVPNYLYLRSRQLERRTVHIGVVDPSGTLSFPRTFNVSGSQPSDSPTDDNEPKLPRSGKLRLPSDDLSQTWLIDSFADVRDGERALVDRRIEYLYVFGRDFGRNGKVETIARRRGPFDMSQRPPMTYLLREQLLKGKVDDDTVARAQVPMVESTVFLDDNGRRIADPATDQLVSLLFPYAMILLLMMALLGSSTYILRSLVEEKDSRIQEVLLSAVRPSDLFYGKIVGLGALGLFQLAVWMLFAFPVAFGFLSVVAVPPVLGVIFFVYFVFGYMLYAAIIAGIGAIGSTEKESNQIFAIFVLMLTSPLLFMPILLDAPNGVLVRFFSLFPFTSPLMMVMRTVNGSLNGVDLAISLTILTLSVWVAMRLSLKIFKLGLLLYGKSPSIAEVWKAAWT